MQTIKLAWRSIWRNRRRTLITVASIALGLSLAIVFISIGDGMYAKLIDDAVRTQGGHISLEHPQYRDAPSIDLAISEDAGLSERIEQLPEVERTKGLILGQGVAKSGAGGVGVAVMGIEPKAEVISSPISKHIVLGKYLEAMDDRMVVVGSELARQLKLDVGKKMVLSTNDVHGNLVDQMVRVKGIFKIGAEEVDGYLVQIPIQFARTLYGLSAGEVTQLGVLCKNPNDRDDVMQKISAMVDPSKVKPYTWEEVMPDLASYIHMDRGSNLVFQGFLLFLILFTIFNTLLMSVLERQHEFGVLLAIGTPPARLMAQILLESAFIGFLGCLVGLLAGGGLGLWLQVHGLDMRSLMKENMAISGFVVSPMIHARMTPQLLLVLFSAVFGATLLLCLYPMRRIRRISVVDSLR
jgi:ABC-type lipoprotein release transport system permease subunit